MAGGVTCAGKAFVSQCAPKAPIGVTFRQKVLRYQRTAQSVLNRGLGGLPLNEACAVTRFYVFMSGQHGAHYDFGIELRGSDVIAYPDSEMQDSDSPDRV
jgi:hypothetical protein